MKDITSTVWTKKQFMWRTRRGTKELDFMLSRFMQNAFDELDDEQAGHFQRLLTDMEDPDLQKWLTDDVKPNDTSIHLLQQDKGLSDIVSKIRQANHC